MPFASYPVNFITPIQPIYEHQSVTKDSKSEGFYCLTRSSRSDPKLVAVEDVVVSGVPFGRSFSIDSVVTQPDASGIPYAKLNFMEVLENNRGTTGAMHKCVVTV